MKENKELGKFLRAELSALESGQYGVSERQPWRARLVFEDCPCCPNFGKRERTVPCSQCALIDLVPKSRRREKVPCRFIPLNAKGETIDSLYRTGTEPELEAAMAEWLRKAIHELESAAAKETVATSPVSRSAGSGRRGNANN